MSMITVQNIKKKYINNTVLDDVSLTVQKGERVALVGSNGSGKTTLLKIIMGFEEPDEGRVIIPGSAKIGYMSQSFSEFYNEEADSKTATFVSEIDALENKIRKTEHMIADSAGEELDALLKEYSRLNDRFTAMDGYSFEVLLKSALNGLGLGRESLSVPLSKLSGGEKLRVMLARTVISKPDLLVLDEPTNHLDIKALEWLEDYLVNFEGAMLLVSHDRVFLDKTATRVAELEYGTLRIMKSGYTEYLRQKEILKDFHFKKRKDIERKIKNEKIIVTTLRHQRKISAFNSRLKKIERLEKELETLRQSGVDMHLGKIPISLPGIHNDVHVSAEAAKAEGLSKGFGNKTLFKDASFLIRGDDKVGIIGDNGTGKTTLLNILSGKDNDYAGSAGIGGWIRYGFIGQDVSFEDETLSVLEKIKSEAIKAGYGEMSDREALAYCADYKFYGEETGKRLSVLSGGERSRLAMAIVMLSKPNCLVMDEPTNHMDIYAREIMNDAFAAFPGAIIAVSHDRHFLRKCINRILALEDGKIIVVEGNYDEYLRMREAEGKTPEETKQKTKAGGGGKGTKEPVIEEEKGKTQTEKMINELEEYVVEFEKNINDNTGYDEYEEYGRKKTKLEELYKEWVKQMN